MHIYIWIQTYNKWCKSNINQEIQRKLINQERLREELEMKYHSEKTKSMAKDKQIAELTNEKNEYQNKLMAMYRQEVRHG